MNRSRLILACLLSGLPTAGAVAGGAQQQVLDQYAAEARAADPSFSGFSAARGQTLFTTRWTTGQPDLPSCTSCHTSDPHNAGRTPAGKSLEPMAASASPTRFSDIAKTEKWFGRNCHNVIGRPCAPVEKGDFITFMLSQ
jgi:hypothetical protein